MLLWLAWFAAFLEKARVFAPLSAQATQIAHLWLDRIEQGLSCLIMLRAMPYVRRNNALHYASRRRTDTQMRRAIIGSAIRRSLRSKDLNQRIEALSQNVEALVARLLKRLPRGLTRRRPHRARPEPRRTAHPIICAEAALRADTS